MAQNSKGYLLGKLFAQLEREGAVAMRDYQNASTTPKGVVSAFINLAAMGKMDTIADVMNELPMDAFNDAVFSPSDQADFPLGYWHEKARMRRIEEQGDPEEAFTAHLLVRLEPSLKDWTMQQGGSKFVRSLLRTERTKRS